MAIEAIFNYLKHKYQIWHTRHRSMINAMSHLIAALAAYTIEPLYLLDNSMGQKPRMFYFWTQELSSCLCNLTHSRHCPQCSPKMTLNFVACAIGQTVLLCFSSVTKP